MKAISTRLKSGRSLISYLEPGEWGFWVGYCCREGGPTRDCGLTVTMFSRAEPTSSFLYLRGQINSSSFSPYSYLLHLRSCLQHNPQVVLPSLLQSSFSFSYISEANSVVKTKNKQKMKTGETAVALAHQPGYAPLLVPPSLLPLLCPLHGEERRQNVAA